MGPYVSKSVPVISSSTFSARHSFDIRWDVKNTFRAMATSEVERLGSESPLRNFVLCRPLLEMLAKFMSEERDPFTEFDFFDAKILHRLTITHPRTHPLAMIKNCGIYGDIPRLKKNYSSSFCSILEQPSPPTEMSTPVKISHEVGDHKIIFSIANESFTMPIGRCDECVIVTRKKVITVKEVTSLAQCDLCRDMQCYDLRLDFCERCSDSAAAFVAVIRDDGSHQNVVAKIDMRGHTIIQGMVYHERIEGIFEGGSHLLLWYFMGFSSHDAYHVVVEISTFKPVWMCSGRDTFYATIIGPTSFACDSTETVIADFSMDKVYRLQKRYKHFGGSNGVFAGLTEDGTLDLFDSESGCRHLSSMKLNT